jgi:hypothetical protein
MRARSPTWKRMAVIRSAVEKRPSDAVKLRRSGGSRFAVRRWKMMPELSPRSRIEPSKT